MVSAFSDIFKNEKLAKTIDPVCKNVFITVDCAVFVFPDLVNTSPLYLLAQNPKLRTKYLGKNHNKFVFTFMDPLLLEQPANSPSRQLLNSTLYPELPQFSELQKLIDKGKEIVLVVENPEKVKDPGTLFYTLERLKKRLFNKITYVFVLESYSQTLLDALNNNIPFSDVLRNPLVLGFDSKHFHEGSLKKEALGEKYHLDYLTGLLKRLSSTELKMLKKAVVGGKLNPQEQFLENIYEKTGLISELKKEKSPFRQALNSIETYNELSLKSMEVVEDIVDLKHLSKSEKAILKAMSHSEGLFTKDELANVIWGNKSLDKFSYWALDQRMSRLRAKLLKAGYRPDILTTVKGKGYILNV